MKVVRYADRPDLRERRYRELTKPSGVGRHVEPNVWLLHRV